MIRHVVQPHPRQSCPTADLWGTAAAERLRHPPGLALTLGQAVAGAGARTNPRHLGISEEQDREAEKRSTNSVWPLSWRI